MLRTSADAFSCAGRLREIFMGSTANFATHHSRVPVLVLR
jgi:nucleotide-binding universal stress UspA family protein